MIVNIGCSIAQSGAATPEDIDKAVMLGLGYPHGPLGFGDTVGADRILEILISIFEMTGDPRYRPTPWLRRRALLGLSLLTTET
jgi:3-hydroxybutyryl-CoA dehydrogenase